MKTPVRRALAAATLALSMAIPLTATAPSAMAITPDRSPFYVDEVEILYLESWPVQVQLVVTGSVPSPCHEPAWAVSDDGFRVTVELWSEADPGLACATVLEEVEVVIPVGDYEEATRAVVVNDRLVEVMQVGQRGSDSIELVGAGWSFGFCAGYCRADLTVIGDRLYLQGSDDWPGDPSYANLGTLTPAGAAQLAAALAVIDPGTLDETYGCPDCADGGAAWVGLLENGRGSRHDMPFGDPPPELAELYELTQGFIGTLETCDSDELVTADDDCTPYESR